MDNVMRLRATSIGEIVYGLLYGASIYYLYDSGTRRTKRATHSSRPMPTKGLPPYWINGGLGIILCVVGAICIISLQRGDRFLSRFRLISGLNLLLGILLLLHTILTAVTVGVLCTGTCDVLCADQYLMISPEVYETNLALGVAPYAVESVMSLIYAGIAFYAAVIARKSNAQLGNPAMVVHSDQPAFVSVPQSDPSVHYTKNP